MGIKKKKSDNDEDLKKDNTKKIIDSMNSQQLSTKQKKKLERKARFKEKLDMYDMIVANLIAGKSIIEPKDRLEGTQIAIGFSNIASETQITKYFIIRQFPDYMQSNFIDYVRSKCAAKGVRINFSFYANPYKINWDSAEMRNKMAIWRKYSADNSKAISVFDYRHKRGDSLAKDRIIMSTKYLNEAELDHKRSLMRVAFLIEISANRDDDSIINMIDAINKFKGICNAGDIKVRELRVNMIDWIQCLGVLSLKRIREVDNKISRKVITDDILAIFNSYKQGRVGKTGQCLGIDVLSNVPVLKQFKQDPDAAENWLISAETGGGKSYYVKVLLSYLLASGFVVTVMDYEGDEYSNYAAYISAGNPEDVKVISMGKGSTIYFDPTEIPKLTGDPEVDDELKETAVSYILAIFRVIVAGINGSLTQWEESVLSLAIQRVYDSAGVTNDKRTWHRSKGLRLSMVYEEVKSIVERKELVDYDCDNVKHKAAMNIAEASQIYFEEGQSKSGTFKHPMSANELYKAKFIIFSFGMKGAGNSIADRTVLALKQLSVACISTQISNHCKYVRHCFNVKVWEEFQRWGEAEGSSEIILNAMTGGRKRGDVNFIITNDLASILDDENKIAKGIRQNIQNMAIGKIKDKTTRRRFCQTFEIMECEPALDRIAKAHSTEESSTSAGTGSSNRYKNSFCLLLDNGKKAIVKVMLPPSLKKSQIFKTGVVTKEAK